MRETGLIKSAFSVCVFYRIFRSTTLKASLKHLAVLRRGVINNYTACAVITHDTHMRVYVPRKARVLLQLSEHTQPQLPCPNCP